MERRGHVRESGLPEKRPHHFRLSSLGHLQSLLRPRARPHVRVSVRECGYRDAYERRSRTTALRGLFHGLPTPHAAPPESKAGSGKTFAPPHDA